jgi:hypothetical protein
MEVIKGGQSDTNCQRTGCESGKPGKWFPVLKVMVAGTTKQNHCVVPLRTCDDCRSKVTVEEIAQPESLDLLDKQNAENGLGPVDRSTCKLAFAEPAPLHEDFYQKARRDGGYGVGELCAYKAKPGYGTNPLLKYPRNVECFCGSKKKSKNCCLLRLNPYLPQKECDMLAQYMRDFREHQLKREQLPVLTIR